MDAIEVLFELIFPAWMLEVAGRVWTNTCTNCRAGMMAATFDKYVDSQTLATWNWDEFSPEEQAELLLTMCAYDEPRTHLGVELSNLKSDDAATIARALGVQVRMH